MRVVLNLYQVTATHNTVDNKDLMKIAYHLHKVPYFVLKIHCYIIDVEGIFKDFDITS